MNLDPALAERAVTPRTRALLPVHLFGRPCAMDELMDLAGRRGLKVLEDCAQSFGARARSRFTGTLGHMGAFSFFPSKNLGTYGDGGLVVTDDDGLAAAVRALRVHGSLRKYHNETVGYNSRLDELHAAMLRVKLPRLEAWNEGRARVGKLVRELVNKWTELRMSWDDANSHAFEERYIRRIEEDARMAVSAMDQIVWTVNPRNDSVPNLASFLSEYAQEFFRPTSIRCRLDVPVNLPEQALSAMARHEIFLAVKEAFNNVAKHAAAGETWLRIRCSARELEIEIEDNGCGFEAGPRESAGNGLGNMGRRLGGLGGRTEISSQPGRGTRVRFVLPLGDAAPAVQGKAGADGALPDDASGAAPP